MSYGLLLDFCYIHVACETIEIDFIISYYNVSFHLNGSHTPGTLWWKLHPSLFFLFSGLFASNYTETHYLEDGTVVTGTHDFTVCFFTAVISFLNYFCRNDPFLSPATQQLLLFLAFSFLKAALLFQGQRKSRFRLFHMKLWEDHFGFCQLGYI